MSKNKQERDETPTLHICAGHGVPMTHFGGKVCCGVCMRDRAERWERMAEYLYNDFTKMCMEFGIKKSPSQIDYETMMLEAAKRDAEALQWLTQTIVRGNG